MSLHTYIDQPTSQKQHTVNLRLYERNVPSSLLQPYLDARPVLTKYAILPIVDPRAPINTPLIQQATFNTETMYNPGNDTGPWSGYASNVNRESELRNQLYALQNCEQSVYVPSSNSNLYKFKWQNNNAVPVSQPFPDLFNNSNQFPPHDPNINSDMIGFAMFNNATRQQTKDLTRPTKCNASVSKT
jgi:hypothetical protein